MMNTARNIDTIPTWLPCFPGFYNTVFEPQFDSELEYLTGEGNELPETADVGDLLYGWNNGAYERAVIQCICDHMPGYFPKEAGILECVFEKVVSPKEYNFVNDSANVSFVIDMERFAPWLREYLKQHAKEWEDCIRRHYTSYDGFCSFYSNDVADWNEAVEAMLECKEVERDRTYHRRAIDSSHLLGRVLEFVLDTESEAKRGDEFYIKMYYDVSDHVYVGEFIDLEKVKQHIA